MPIMNIEIRRIFDDALGDRDLSNEFIEFYESVLTKKYDLVICMARKAWALYNAVRPLLSEEARKAKVTHDRAMGTWFNDCVKTPSRICILDDTCVSGRGIIDCIDRLRGYKLPPVENGDAVGIDVRVFTYIGDESGKRNLKGKIEKAGRENTSFTAERTQPTESEPVYSEIFIKAIHAVGVPYIAHLPAFEIRDTESLFQILDHLPESDSTEEIALSGLESKLIENGQVKIDDKLYKFINTTVDYQSDVGVEEFILRAADEDTTLYSHSTFRFLFNRQRQTMLFVPYVRFDPVDIHPETVDLRTLLPDSLKKYCGEEKYDRSKSSDPQNYRTGGAAAQRTAQRLLSYAFSYSQGVELLKALGVKYEQISYGGFPFPTPDKDLSEAEKFSNSLTEHFNQSLWATLYPKHNDDDVVMPEDQAPYVDAFKDLLVDKRPAFNIIEESSNNAKVAKKVNQLELYNYLIGTLYAFKPLKRKISSSDGSFFRGFPLRNMRKWINEAIDGSSETVSKEAFDVLINQLCETGAGRTSIVQLNNPREGTDVICTVLIDGEDAERGLAVICSGLAYVSQNFKHISETARNNFSRYAEEYAIKYAPNLQKIITQELNDYRNIGIFSNNRPIKLESVNLSIANSAFFLGLYFLLKNNSTLEKRKLRATIRDNAIREKQFSEISGLPDAVANAAKTVMSLIRTGGSTK